MSDEKSRRRPAGTASRSNGDNHDSTHDVHIVAGNGPKVDSCSRSDWTWTDSDSEQIVAFIDRCIGANSDSPQSVQHFSIRAEGGNVE